MHGRNPFTAINNLSFVRNASHFSQNRPALRSCSGGTKYSSYQGSYLRDPYLSSWQTRRNQQTLASKLLGIESLRYQPEPIDQQFSEPIGPSFQSRKEYYNLQTAQSPSPSLPIRSNFQQSKLKQSTKDMFGSEYFNDSCTQVAPNADSVRQMVRLQPRKPSLFKRLSVSGNNVSRFRITQQKLDQFISESENESSRKVATKERLGDPETLYLKSRKTIFYLYRNPDDCDSQ